jgi:hypothetical protein
VKEEKKTKMAVGCRERECERERGEESGRKKREKGK